MTSDTKMICATIIGTGIGTAVAVIAVVVTLVGGVRTDVRSLDVAVDDLRGDMHAAVEGLRDDMHAVVDDLRGDMREDHRAFDARLRNVEIAFGKVDQRLLTIERVVLPSPPPDE